MSSPIQSDDLTQFFLPFSFTIIIIIIGINRVIGEICPRVHHSSDEIDDDNHVRND